MPIRKSLPALAFAATLAVTLAATAAHAGKIADFEAGLRNAYASYRVALFDSNRGNAEATAAAINKFSAQWAGLMTDWRSAPPPQYADDPKWAETLATVASTLDAAKTEAKAGNLPAAHKTLEAVRNALWQLHQRNGIIGFSDRMNAYHAEMEKVLTLDPALYSGKVAPEVVELAGVLDYLAHQIETHPAPEAADPDYAGLEAGFLSAAADFAAAARSGDPAKVKAAIAGLKPAYSKFFLKFG
jgi:soluble cytochrome b562